MVWCGVVAWHGGLVWCSGVVVWCSGVAWWFGVVWWSGMVWFSPFSPHRQRTLVIESIDAVDGGALMVASEEEEVLGILDLVGQQQADGLQGLFAPVHVVTCVVVEMVWCCDVVVVVWNW